MVECVCVFFFKAIPAMFGYGRRRFMCVCIFCFKAALHVWIRQGLEEMAEV